MTHRATKVHRTYFPAFRPASWLPGHGSKTMPQTAAVASRAETSQGSTSRGYGVYAGVATKRPIVQAANSQAANRRDRVASSDWPLRYDT